MVCFLAPVLETALRRKLAALEANVRYDDLLQHLTELRAVEIRLDGRGYLTRTELAGHAPLAVKALASPHRLTPSDSTLSKSSVLPGESGRGQRYRRQGAPPAGAPE